jgi:hypothetical protein
MLNLNAGLILGDDAAYDKAERIFWNALAFNQLITGCFGHRPLAGNGYGVKGKHRLMRRKREVEPGDRLGIPHGWKVVATWAIVGLSIRPAALAAGESVPAGMTSVRTP